MNQLNILLTRIDNRLVHGQVGLTWTATLGANLIVVIDELAAHDPLQQKLMEAVAKSSSVQIRFFTVDQFVSIMENASSDQKIFIVVHSPSVVAELLDKNVPIKVVNVGNMHYERGKMPLTRKVYVDEADLEALKHIESYHVQMYIQDVPGAVSEKLVNIHDIIFKN